MYSLQLLLITTTLLFFVPTTVIGLANDCYFTHPTTGQIYNTSKLTNQGATNGDFYFTSGGHKYWYNPCGQVNYASSGGCSSSSVCQLDSSGGYHSLGAVGTSSWYASGNNAVNQYTTTDDCYRKSRITVRCDSNVQSPGTVSFVSESPMCTYNFEMVLDCAVFTDPITGVSSVPTSGGVVTLDGNKLGTSVSGMTVTVDGVTCSSPAITIPDKQIQCTMPAGTGGNLKGTVSTPSYTTSFVFSYSSPVVSAVSSIDTFGGSITFSGENYGTDNSLIVIQIGEKSCSNINVTTAHTQVVCDIPSGVGKNIQGTFTVDGVESAFTFNYLAPSISNISPDVLITEGQVITFSGANFGDDSASISVKLDGKSCTNLALTTDHEEFSCEMPAGTGSDLDLVVTVGNQAVQQLLSYQSPQVNGTTCDGSVLTISGQNFGGNVDDIDVLAILLKRFIPLNAVCGNYRLVVPHHEFACDVIPGIGADHTAYLSVNGQTTQFSYSYPAPIVTSFTILPTMGGSVTINGSNYGSDASEISVVIGGKSCENITVLSTSQITCEIGSGSGDDVTSSLSVGNQDASFLYSYEGPEISTVSSVNTNGGLITISGSNFGDVSNKISAKVEGQACSGVVITQNHQQFTCTAPAGAGLGRSVVVSIGGLSAENSLDYNAPTILNATVSQDGLECTILGQNFGSKNALVETVNIGGQPCTSPKITVAHTTIVCQIANFTFDMLTNATVEIAGQSSNTLDFSVEKIIVTVSDDNLLEQDSGSVKPKNKIRGGKLAAAIAVPIAFLLLLILLVAIIVLRKKYSKKSQNV